MTPWQWASAPWKMVQWARRRYDVHLMYLPSPLLRRIKQAVTAGVWLGSRNGEGWRAGLRQLDVGILEKSGGPWGRTLLSLLQPPAVRHPQPALRSRFHPFRERRLPSEHQRRGAGRAVCAVQRHARAPAGAAARPVCHHQLGWAGQLGEGVHFWLGRAQLALLPMCCWVPVKRKLPPPSHLPAPPLPVYLPSLQICCTVCR